LRFVGGPAYLTQLLCDSPEPFITGACLIEARKQGQILMEFKCRRQVVLKAREMTMLAYDVTIPMRVAQ
jgi:hypothetical protein